MLVLRRGGIDDLEEVIRLRVAFLMEEASADLESEPPCTDHIRRYVTEKLPSGEFLVWLAEEDERIVGIGGLVFLHRPPGFTSNTGLNAMIFNMYTIPERRGRGIATMLLQHMADYVRTTPAGRILLYATEMGRPVYERFGFTACSNYMSLDL